MTLPTSSYLIRARAYVEAYEQTDQADTKTLRALIHQMSQWSANDDLIRSIPSIQLRLNYCACHFHMITGDFNLANQLFLEVKDLPLNRDDYAYVAKLYNLMVQLSYALGKFSQALDLGPIGIQYARDCGALETQAQLLMNIGIAYSLVDDYTSQLDYFDQALALASTLKSKNLTRLLYNNIAYANYLIANYEVCESNIRAAEQLYAPDDISPQKLALMLTKVALHHHKGELQEARITLALVASNPYLTQDKTTWMDWHLEMARHYELQSQWDSAEKQLKTAHKEAIHYQLGDYQRKIEAEIQALTHQKKLSHS